MAEATDAVSGPGERLEWPSKKSKALQEKISLLTELSTDRGFGDRNIARLPYAPASNADAILFIFRDIQKVSKKNAASGGAA